jgi:hypothetical protein
MDTSDRVKEIELRIAETDGRMPSASLSRPA